MKVFKSLRRNSRESRLLTDQSRNAGRFGEHASRICGREILPIQAARVDDMVEVVLSFASDLACKDEACYPRWLEGQRMLVMQSLPIPMVLSL